MRFLGWVSFSEKADKSVSSLKRDEKEDPLFPLKVETGPNRVGFAEDHVDAWLELLLVRQLELQGHFVSKRKCELERILRGDAFMDESAAGAEADRRRRETAAA